MSDENDQKGPTFYAQFDGDEIDGKRYALGDPIDASAHSGVLLILEMQGRVSTTKPAGAATVPLTDHDKPVANMSRGELERVALSAMSNRIAQASDDDLRGAVESYRAQTGTVGAQDDGEHDDDDQASDAMGAGTGTGETANGGEGEKAPAEKPLNRQTTAELEATAAAEGITFGDDVTNNPERVKAIEAARQKKDEESAS